MRVIHVYERPGTRPFRLSLAGHGYSLSGQHTFYRLFVLVQGVALWLLPLGEVKKDLHRLYMGPL